MNFLSPAIRTTHANGSACRMLVAFVTAALLLVVLGAKDPTITVALFAICLAISWVLAATFLTKFCDGSSLLLALPDLRSNVRVLVPFRISLSLGNGRKHAPALFFTVELETSIGDRLLPSPPQFLGQLEPGVRAEFVWEATVRRRGTFQLLGVRVRNAFPGSLLTYEHRFAFVGERLALPAIYDLDPQSRNILVGKRHAAGRLHSNPSAIEDFIGARDYRPGDNPRNIDLKLSLRAPDFPSQLIVREFEDPSDDDACIILDTTVRTSDQDPLLALYRHEKSISFTIAICRLLLDQKKRVRLRTVSGDGTRIDRLLDRPSHILGVEAWFARLTPVADREPIFELLNESQRRNATVLFISLTDTILEKKNRRLAVLTIPPELQTALVRQVVGA